MSVKTYFDKLKKSKTLVNWMPILTLVILVIIMSIGSPRFLLPANLLGLLSQSATLLVMGLGQTFTILLGSIDLSIAPVAALATIIAAALIPIIGYPAYLVATAYGGTEARPLESSGRDRAKPMSRGRWTSCTTRWLVEATFGC